MIKSNSLYTVMSDGTIKQKNPFTGTEVWCVPGRSYRPMINEITAKAHKLKKRKKEDYCDFCFDNIYKTPPEKSRLIKENNVYKILNFISSEDYKKTRPIFRRVPNLFEIVTENYWKKNYGFTINNKIFEWKNRYLNSEKGKSHTYDILQKKLKLTGKTDKQISEMSDDQLDELSNAFFAGSHELIVADRHYIKDAQYNSQLYSSGEMDENVHFEYIKFTIYSMEQIYSNNKYIRYVSIFQNWLSEAGASFDHLHKQLVGIDEWGLTVERKINFVRENRNIFNELGVNFAIYRNLIIAENEYAVVFSDIGHRYPTIAIFSKSQKCRPNELSENEIKGFSDLLHACHAAMGPHISCNEEWYYTPKDSVDNIPWHVLIKWRTVKTAGFEGVTRIYVNPTSPHRIKEILLPSLFALRDKGKINKKIKIGDECKIGPNCLNYFKNR